MYDKIAERVERICRLIEEEKDQSFADYQIMDEAREIKKLMCPAIPLVNGKKFYCGICQKRMAMGEKQKFCYKCGQKINWSDKDG